MNLEEFLQLKKEVDEWRQKKDRSKGSLDQLRATLKQKFGISTTKQAKLLLKELKEKKEEVAGDIQEALAEIKEKFNGKL